MALSLCPAALFCQSSSSTAISNTIAFYQRSIGDQSGIYNGVQYYRYADFINSGHPFFMFDSLTAGAVDYDGVVYNSVPLLYDEMIDQLLTNDYRKENLVELVKIKVNRFTIANHNFVRIADSMSGIAPGYYRELYSGKSQVLGKEIKTVDKRIINQFEVNRTVETRNSYYARIHKQYFVISGSKQLLKLFGDKRKPVSDFLRNKKARYKSNRENYIVEAVKRYDELSQ
jgi:hypothetical protein